MRESVVAAIYLFFFLFFSLFGVVLGNGILQLVVWGSSLVAVIYIILPKINFNQKVTIPKAFLLYLSLLFFAILGLTEVIDTTAFWKYFRVIASNFMLMCIIYYAIKDWDDVLIIFMGVLVACFFSVFISHFIAISTDESVDDTFRLQGIVGNSNGLGNIAKIGVFCCLILLEKYTKKLHLIILISLIGFFVYSIILSASRGAFLAMSLILGGYIIIKFFSGHRIVVLIVFLYIFGAIMFTFLEKYLKGFFLYQRLTRDQSVSDVRQEARGALFQIAFRLFLENPILGVGLNQFRLYNEEGLISHTDVLNIFVELGIFAGLAYLGMYATLLRGLMKMKKHFDSLLQDKSFALLILLLVAEFIYGFGNPNWFDQNEIVLFAILAGACSKTVFINTYNKAKNKLA